MDHGPRRSARGAEKCDGSSSSSSIHCVPGLAFVRMGMQSNLQKTLSGPLTAEQIPRAPLISPRLSRSVGGGMSKRKLATVAVNCLGAFPAAARVSGGAPRGASRGRLSSFTPPRVRRARAAPHELSWGLRCSDLSRSPHARLAPCLPGRARRTPSRLRRPGPPGGARRRGWWRLPDEAAQSAGSEPFAVRVLPEGWVWSPGGAGWSREFFARKMCAPLALYPSTQSEILETAQF